MSASVGEDKKKPFGPKWYLIILLTLLVIGLAALAVAFRIEPANFREYVCFRALLVSLMVAVAFVTYVPGVPVIFALCWAGKTVEGDGGCCPGVVGAELPSRYEALELLTLIGSRETL